MKLYKFRLHFNQINMKRGNPNVWTVHLDSICFQVKEVKCYVPINTVFRGFDQPQPRAHLEGRASLYLQKDTAYLVDENSFENMTDDDYFEVINGKLYEKP